MDLCNVEAVGEMSTSVDLGDYNIVLTVGAVSKMSTSVDIIWCYHKNVLRP